MSVWMYSNRDAGTRVKQARERQFFTQKDLALRTGLRKSAISHIETGRNAPSVESLCRIAFVLGVKTDWILFGREGDK